MEKLRAARSSENVFVAVRQRDRICLYNAFQHMILLLLWMKGRVYPSKSTT